MTRHTHGFTLLEILVVLAIAGLLFAALSGGTRLGLTALGTERRLTLHDEDLVVLDRVFRQLVGEATTGSLQVATPFRGTAHSLGFTTSFAGAAPPAGSGAADVTIGVDQRHRLVVTWQPHYTGDPPSPQADAVEVLAEAVDHVDIDYAAASSPAAESWQPTWNGEELPDLVRLHIVLQHGGRTRLPDIVAQTRLRARAL